MTAKLLQEVGSESATGAPLRSVQHAAIARAVAVARWQEAEARVYPLIMADPRMYQAAVTAVALVVEQLRATCHVRDDVIALTDEQTVAAALADERTADALHAAALSIGMLCDAARAQLFAVLPG